MTARVTPASSRSREARPGLSLGVRSLGRDRGGAPRGERAPMSPLPRPERIQVATSDCVARTMVGCACRRSASPRYGGRKESNKARALERREDDGCCVEARAPTTARSLPSGGASRRPVGAVPLPRFRGGGWCLRKQKPRLHRRGLECR
jgi:hypothetical protein